jgi:hypothetical protein
LTVNPYQNVKEEEAKGEGRQKPGEGRKKKKESTPRNNKMGNYPELRLGKEKTN